MTTDRREGGPGMGMPSEKIIAHPSMGEPRRKRANGRRPPTVSEHGKVGMLPTNVLAEESLIGSCLIAPSKLPDYEDISAQDFYDHRHRIVWAAMQQLSSRGQKIDVVILTDSLAQQGKLAEIGGVSFVTGLANNVPTSEHAAEYAEIVRRTARHRAAYQFWESLGDALLKYNTEDMAAYWQSVRQSLDEQLTTVAAASPRYQFMTDTEAESMPPVDWLVGGMLPEDSISVLFGEPGSFKSFLALSWGLSIAAGLPWHGKPVQRGVVAYIAAEGVRGIGKRIKAWKQHHNLEDVSVPIRVLGEAVPLLDPVRVQDLIASIQSWPEPPIMVVIDTLARSMEGGDENAAKDINSVTNAADLIRRAFNAHVLIVHHSGKDKAKGARGSSAIRGNVETEILVEKSESDSDVIVVRSGKAKEEEDFKPLTLRKVKRWLNDEATVSSCVLVMDAEQVAENVRSSRRRVTSDDKLLALMRVQGDTYADLCRRFEAQYQMSPKTFEAALGRLAAANLVAKDELGEWHVTSKGADYPTNPILPSEKGS